MDENDLNPFVSACVLVITEDKYWICATLSVPQPPTAHGGKGHRKHQKRERRRVFSTDTNISAELGISPMCTARLLLLTSGCQDAPKPTPTRVPLRCGLDSPIRVSVRQAYYSHPEGALSLLTGRHKYSSTSSPRVNGCPSGCGEPHRRTARLLQTCGVAMFVARSFT